MPAQQRIGLQLDEGVDEGILTTLVQPPDHMGSGIRWRPQEAKEGAAYILW
ncbi:MAG TPA: hypothetical protein VLE71_01265 [Actinomycetota bacterium]|nr:hypothetical protein [Actinomycetota bacterium]